MRGSIPRLAINHAIPTPFQDYLTSSLFLWSKLTEVSQCVANLTTKQQKFVDGLVAGLSQRQAFIQAGYSTKGKSDNYIDVEANRLRNNPKVSLSFSKMMNEHKNKALWTREEAVNTLKWLVNQAVVSIKDQDEGYVRQGTSSAIISAIQELNKLEMLLPEDDVKLRKAKAELELLELEIANLKGETDDEAHNIGHSYVEALNETAQNVFGDDNG